MVVILIHFNLLHFSDLSDEGNILNLVNTILNAVDIGLMSNFRPNSPAFEYSILP